MASSLSAECTPLKTKYDSCFNSWFEGYLEPAVSASASTPAARAAYSKQKAEEYESSCGKLFEAYQACVKKAVKERGLEDMLDQARQENPLTTSPPAERSYP